MLLLMAVGASGWGRSSTFHVMESLVLYLDLDAQPVLVPNLLVGAAKDDVGVVLTLDIKRRLMLIRKLRLCCKAYKTIVDKSAEYNALRLAQYEYAMCPKEVKWACFPREHSLISQFHLNLMWFSRSRHVSTKLPRRICMSDLEDLSLPNLTTLRNELEMCWCAVEFYGMIFESFYPYWTCPANRVYRYIPGNIGN